MEEIDISQLLGYFKSKVIYIIFAMSIAFCVSSIYVNRFRVPEYTSSTTILINKANETGTINTSDLNVDKTLVPTYGEIIKSKRVLREVINNLALDLEYRELYSEVSVGEVTDTTIIKISVTNTDSALAAEIANEIASVFSEEIVEIYKIENISIIDEAEINDVATSASTIKIVGISTIAGAIIAVGVIFAIFYFDTTIKNEEDIERATGLPVIGSVPMSREKIKASAHRKFYEEQAKKHKAQEILPVEREIRKVDLDKTVNIEKEIGIHSVEHQIVNTDLEEEKIFEEELPTKEEVIKEDLVTKEIDNEEKEEKLKPEELSNDLKEEVKEEVKEENTKEIPQEEIKDVNHTDDVSSEIVSDNFQPSEVINDEIPEEVDTNIQENIINDSLEDEQEIKDQDDKNFDEPMFSNDSKKKYYNNKHKNKK